ncbi:MAG: nucleotidyltransferase domain-containing protein [Deltaproteobacteria bacterium]|nr:nucleotidyltransferase domain-containing protein [Deltaproteobacteria bacterium]
MKRIDQPESIFPRIIEDCRAIFDDGLLSIILFGSAAGPDYRPGLSDINFLIILSDEAIDDIDRALGFVAKWRKQKVAVPLFMTASYIQSSLDSYPLEFLMMKNLHRTVYGKDVLSDLAIEPEFLRLQCEREIKGKLLLLRESFLASEGKDSAVRELMARSITAFLSIFTGLLSLRNIAVPSSRRAVVATVGELFGIDAKPFLACLDVKENRRAHAGEGMNLFREYLRAVRKLWQMADAMDLREAPGSPADRHSISGE